MSFNLKWRNGNRLKICHENTIPDCPPDAVYECENLDVVFVLDSTESMEPAFLDAVNRINLYLDIIEAKSTSYQLGLITFKDSPTTELSLSVNNRTAFEAALAAVTPAGGGFNPEDVNGGLWAAVSGSAGTWRANAKKLVILVTDAVPGGTDDVADPADITDLYAAAADGLSNNIYTSCVHVPLTYIPPDVGYNAYVADILRNTAAQGGGVFTQATGDEVAPAFAAIFDSQCYDDGGELVDGYEDTSLRCCRMKVCKLCLRFEAYGEDTLYGTATGSGTKSDPYTGLINGVTFSAYWGLRDSCRLYVYMAGELQATFPKCPDYGEDGASCRAPYGEFPYTFDRGDAYDELAGTLYFYEYEVERLRRNDGVTPGACTADVAVLLDVEYRNEAAIEDVQASALQDLIDNISATVDSARFALVKFGRDASSVVTDFTTGSAFLSLVDTLSNEADDNAATVDEARRSDLAMAHAETLSWRNDGNRIVILVSSGTPGDHATDPTPDPNNTQELAQLASASALFVRGIKTHAVSGSIPTGAGSFFFHPRNQATQLEVSQYGGGTHQSVNPDGAANYNSGVNELAPAINSLAAQINCGGDGACATHFCGNCDCVCKKLCLKVTVDSDVWEAIMDWGSDQVCELGVTDPNWLEASVITQVGTFEGSEFALVKGDYDECRLTGKIVFTPNEGEVVEFAIDKEVDLCNDIQVSDVLVVGYDEYPISIVCATCGTCNFGFVECCNGSIVPETIYGRFYAQGLIQTGPGTYKRIDRDVTLNYSQGDFEFQGVVPSYTWTFNGDGSLTQYPAWVAFSCGNPGADATNIMRMSTIIAKVENPTGTPRTNPDDWDVDTDTMTWESFAPVDSNAGGECIDAEWEPESDAADDPEIEWSLGSLPLTWPSMQCSCDPLIFWGSGPGNNPVLISELEIGGVPAEYEWDGGIA